MRRCFLLLLAVLIPATAAAVPLNFQHQGRLSDGVGQPLDGALPMTFTLFDAPATGNSFWSEDRSVDFDNGYFSVSLGEISGLDTTDFEGRDDVWMELSVNGQPPLGRIQLASVPFAFRAASAGTADSAITASTADLAVRATNADTADVATTIASGGTVDASVIVNLPFALGDLNCGSTQVARYSGSGWECAADNAHQHGAADIASGLLDVARLPVGTTSSHVAAGDHGHAIGDLTGTLDFSDLTGSIGYSDLTGSLAFSDLSGSLGFSDLTGSLDYGDLTGSMTTDDTIVANGGVQLGNGATCASGTAGTIRYENNALEVCDGSEWLTVSVTGSGDGSSRAKAGVTCRTVLAEDPGVASGTYWIDPDNDADHSDAFQVHCDMDTDGGGWTRCLSAKYFAGAKPAGWAKNTWVSAEWNTGTTVFSERFGGSAYGNFCKRMLNESSELYGATTYDPSSGWADFRTASMPLNGTLFDNGADGTFTGSGSAIGIDSDQRGIYNAGCSTQYTSNTYQDMQSLCISNGTLWQAQHTGWTAGQYPISCGDSANQPCFCSQGSYCGGSNTQENKIVMALYVR